MATNTAQTDQLIQCYHCGEPCDEQDIVFDKKHFCCQGCQMVYEVLNENGLCSYYELEESPGVNLISLVDKRKFDFLEDKTIAARVLQFSSEALQKVSFHIPAIHCSSCIWLLEHLERINPGVLSSRVNFVRKEANIDFNPKVIGLRELVVLLSSLGYEPEINLQNVDSSSKTRTNDRKLFIQIGVAGFCFGNIMLLSLPEYFGFEGLNERIQIFITWVNILLVLPVVLYSAQDYYISALKALRRRYINIDVPIVLGITALFIRSTYEIIGQTGPGYLDSLSGLVFFLLIGRWFQNKTYEGLSFERDYRSFLPLAVKRSREEGEEMIQISELKVNDRIMIRNKEVIPADASLLSDHAVIDYSFVTGESRSVEKSKGELIFAGGKNIGSSIRLEMNKPVSQSYLTDLWNNQTFSEETRFDRIIDQVARYFTGTVLGIAMLTAVYWYLIDASHMLNAMTAVLIVACPCALSLATPFTLGNVLAIIGKHKYYARHTSVIEKLWSVNKIVFDKTGTLTYSSKSKVGYEGRELTDLQLSMIGELSAQSTHPLSRIMSREFSSSGTLEVMEFCEKPGGGIAGWINGTYIQLGSARFVGRIDHEHTSAQLVHLAIDQQYYGKFLFSNSYRKNLSELIHKLRKYSMVVLSGDNEAEKTQLKKIFPSDTKILFHQSPQDKLDFIKSLQNRGAHLLMLGDGLNDAGALKQADVGIAVTEDVSAFTPACDIIALGRNLTMLDRILDLVINARGVIYLSFVISFLYNVIGLGFAVSAHLTPLYAAILMPLSSVSVVAFATFTIRLMAAQKKL